MNQPPNLDISRFIDAIQGFHNSLMVLPQSEITTTEELNALINILEPTEIEALRSSIRYIWYDSEKDISIFQNTFFFFFFYKN